MIINNLEIDVIRKPIKNMHLYVLSPDGQLRVSVPFTIQNEQIEMFVLSKMGWIKKKQARFLNQPSQTEKNYISGESHYLWGQRYQLITNINNRANSVTVQGEKIYISTRAESTVTQRKNIIKEWYRRELKEKALPLIEKWQKIIGVETKDWSVKNMTSKWGTCNTRKKRIWLNLQLAKKPLNCLELIVIHELCHLKVPNHSADFKALMNKYLPDWKSTQKSLNQFIMDKY